MLSNLIFVVIGSKMSSSNGEMATLPVTMIHAFSSVRQKSRLSLYLATKNFISDTREGRCGEWANAFGAILRSFDFHVRECHNVFADHVWVEGKSVQFLMIK